MEPNFREAAASGEGEDLVAFLCAHEWPFHGTPRPTPEQARGMEFGLPAARTFWIDVGGAHAGLLRLTDVEDIGTGSPLIDVRLAPAFRGRGLGRRAVAWLAATVFREYPAAHRIEATTRIDNVAMRRVLERCGFRLEGRLRETWPVGEGARTDTAIYGLLRGDADRRSSADAPGVRVEASDAAPEADLEAIRTALRTANRAANPAFYALWDLPANAERAMHVVAYAPDGAVAGGLIGSTRLEWLDIDILAVRAADRGRGIGRRLMRAAEQEAVRRGCRYAAVDTAEFQAPGFYQRLGYDVAGRFEDRDGRGNAKVFFTRTLR